METRVKAPRAAASWLLPARIAWPVVAVAALVLLCSSIPALVEQGHHVCPRGCPFSAEDLSALQAAGIPLDLALGFKVSVMVAFALVWLLVATIIFLRKSRDAMGLCTAFFLVTFPLGFLQLPAAVNPGWRALSLVFVFLAEVLGRLFFYVFPDGRFMPRLMRWVWLAACLYFGARTFLPASELIPLTRYSLLDSVAFLASLGSGIAVQVHRYRRISTPAQRRQTKWVVLGTTVALLGFLAVIGLLIQIGQPPRGIGWVAAFTLVFGFVLLIPISIGIAILRAGLWDIDLIINRALVYGTLTTSLVGLYVLLVAGAGTIRRGRFDPLVTLIAAGLIVVLFQPLQRRLQHAVNRLFYGERDDPYVVLSRMGRRMQETVTPDAVLPTFVQTVASTLKLPYVAIALDPPAAVVASHGSPGGPSTS